MQQKKTLIVGGGPVGVALACQLRCYGISCRIVEKRFVPTQHSKAININAASLHMLHKMGMIKRFLDRGKKVQNIYVHWEKKRVAHVNYGKLRFAYPFFLSLPQSVSEQILGEYLKDFNQPLERGTELIDVSVDSDKVTVLLRNTYGQIEKAYFDFLVACDGHKSTVRVRLGIPFKGVDHHKHFLLFDGLVEWRNRIDSVHYFVAEKGYFILAPIAEGYYRMVLSDALNGMHSYALADMQKLIAECGPEDLVLKKVLWESKGFFQNRLLDDFCYQKRIFFCGDAAHIFSPLGGLGMNTGLQDINNLAWKLAGVIQKDWPDLILETYSIERKAVAEQLIANTDISTRLINRSERETPNVIQWLPSLQNKHLIQKRPYQFSGLAQRYPNAEFLPSDSPLIGTFLPYAEFLQIRGSSLNSFQLQHSTPSIIIFNSKSKELEALIKPYSFPLYAFSEPNSLKELCQAEDRDFLLLRPDGVIGFYGKCSSLQSFQIYLERWYVPTPR